MKVWSCLDEACGVFAILGGSCWEWSAEEFVADDGVHVAADLGRIAMRVKPGLDVSALSPFPAVFFELGFGACFFEGEALLFDGEAFGGEVATAKRGDVLAELAE